ncbi:MAG TPA: cytochrome c biogenesis protein DipZ [Dongiaceae bacterium]|jgi:cytochrome c biogenesis protein CcdA/thiol-disulfide isomerase/thioredoxin|nr:cytochrome c biogenesis protein DipZ [Dongiaceae bacterium]
MTLIVLSYVAGILTIVSPCILPVLPFVFASAGGPFHRNGLPLLAGLALTFVLFASVATVGGGWIVTANEYGRDAALVLLALFGLTLLIPSLAERITRPLVRLGGRLSETGEARSGIAKPLLLGVATGLLWAPCAGPILGLILTGAALQGASAKTVVLLLAYAAGSATSLAVALAAGGRFLGAMKRSLGFDEWLKRALGVAVLAGVALIAVGADRGILTRLSSTNTAAIEQWLLDKAPGRSTATTGAPANTMAMTGSNAAMSGAMTDSAAMTGSMSGEADGGAMMSSANAAEAVPAGISLDALKGADAWFNSDALDAAKLKGKVVVVDFWTYSCINCLRSLPYVKAWAEKYADQGLVVIGVHSPEFAFERDQGNVQGAIKDLGVAYPVAIDNDYKIWRAFSNQYWPAHYFFDANGKLRYRHFGEGKYEQSELVIRGLLAERNGKPAAGDLVKVSATGEQAASDIADVQSPETYIGMAKQTNFASPEDLLQDETQTYTAPSDLALNDWGFGGAWTEGAESAALAKAPGKIVFRFHARDLHLVLGPGADGKPVRFRVTLDGAAPADAHGTDIDAEGDGTVKEQRLYQLIRQPHAVADHTFEIEFLDPGVQAYSFTFG